MITSDCVVQFMSSVWSLLCMFLEIMNSSTTFSIQGFKKRNPKRVVSDKHFSSLQSLKMLGEPLWKSKIVVF